MKNELQKPVRGKGESTFTIDWWPLKEIVATTLADETAAKQGFRTATVRLIDCNVISPSRSFHGYTQNQLREWVRDGYRTNFLGGFPDVAPVRDKRKYQFVEEGDELVIDRALSGEDFCEARWTDTKRLPGISLECQLSFVCHTDPKVVIDYNVWICRAVASLEAAGIDCGVTMKFSSSDTFPGSGMAHSIVRVKREGEQADFASFSPMLSPAAFRTFGFVAHTLHAEQANTDVSYSLGYGHGGTAWNVEYNAERETIQTFCPYNPGKDFPAEMMDRKLREALSKING